MRVQLSSTTVTLIQLWQLIAIHLAPGKGIIAAAVRDVPVINCCSRCMETLLRHGLHVVAAVMAQLHAAPPQLHRLFLHNAITVMHSARRSRTNIQLET